MSKLLTYLFLWRIMKCPNPKCFAGYVYCFSAPTKNEKAMFYDEKCSVCKGELEPLELPEDVPRNDLDNSVDYDDIPF